MVKSRRIFGVVSLLVLCTIGLLPVRLLPASASDKRPTFNVRKFGARGDGVTNDTRSIQAAIDAAVRSGGGIVYVPKGTYRVSTPAGTTCSDQPYCAALSIHGSHVSMVGDSRSASTLTNGDETNILLRIGGLETTPIKGPLRDVMISKLRLTNSGVPQSTAAGGAVLYFDTRRGTIEYSVIDDIVIDGSGLTGVTMHGSHNTLRNSWIRNTAEHGVYMAGDHMTRKPGRDQSVVGNRIEFPAAHQLSRAMHSFADAIKVTSTYDGLISGNTIRLGAAPSEGINVEESAHSMVVTNNRIMLGGANQIGLRVSAAHISVNGGSVDGGRGYENTIGADARPTARASTLRGVVFRGAWVTSVLVQRGGAKDVAFKQLELRGAPHGGWAIDLTSASRPTISHSKILAGDYGINLGTSDGARLVHNRIESKYKYDTSGPPSNYEIED